MKKIKRQKKLLWQDKLQPTKCWQPKYFSKWEFWRKIKTYFWTSYWVTGWEIWVLKSFSKNYVQFLNQVDSAISLRSELCGQIVRLQDDVDFGKVKHSSHKIEVLFFTQVKVYTIIIIYSFYKTIAIIIMMIVGCKH